MQLAENTGRKKLPEIQHLRTIAHLCRAISLQLRHMLTIGKNLLNSNISPTCPYNMVNFDPLAAEICWRVWGTPGNFNGLSSVTARHSSSGRQPSFPTLDRGRHLYSAGRPSRSALAHILVEVILSYSLFVYVCFCCVRFSFFSTVPRDWL